MPALLYSDSALPCSAQCLRCQAGTMPSAASLVAGGLFHAIRKIPPLNGICH